MFCAVSYYFVNLLTQIAAKDDFSALSFSYSTTFLLHVVLTSALSNAIQQILRHGRVAIWHIFVSLQK